MCRQRTAEARRECRSSQKTGEPTTARRVELQHVNGLAGKHPPEIERTVTIFAGGHIHTSGDGVAHTAQVVEMIRTHRLLKPADAAFAEPFRQRDRLFGGVRSVRIDKECCVCTDSVPRRANAFRIATRLGPDLHLHAANAVLHPPG